jgi:hypothetical protein
VPSLADGKAASAVKKRILALSPAPSAPEIASLFAAELGLEGFLPSFLASPGSTPFRNLLSSNRLPFLPAEKSVVLSSLSLPPSAAAALSSLLSRCAHLSHKNWSATLTFANELEEILGGGPSDSELFGRLFPRVLEGGNWAGAREYALPQVRVGGGAGRERSAALDHTFNSSRLLPPQGVEGGKIKGRGKPWLVLVSGLNGIRKTTSTYQPWFADVLGDALEGQWEGGEGELPTGQNSFFRQLDFMICSLAAVDFKHMCARGREGELLLLLLTTLTLPAQVRGGRRRGPVLPAEGGPVRALPHDQRDAGHRARAGRRAARHERHARDVGAGRGHVRAVASASASEASAKRSWRQRLFDDRRQQPM